MIIDILCEEFEAWRQTLPESAVPKLEEFPRPGGAGRVVRVSVKAPVREAEVTVWKSGEADLLIGNLVTGEIEAVEHAELTSRSAPAACWRIWRGRSVMSVELGVVCPQGARR